MILLISGPSGAGKSTVLQRLLAANPRSPSRSRPPRASIRAGEVEGRDYHFVDDVAFDRLVAEDAFVEWANVHCTATAPAGSHLRGMEAAGRVPLLDIDVQGGVQVLERFGDDWCRSSCFRRRWDELERRLRGRGTDDETVIATRLAMRAGRWVSPGVPLLGGQRRRRGVRRTAACNPRGRGLSPGAVAGPAGARGRGAVGTKGSMSGSRRRGRRGCARVAAPWPTGRDRTPGSRADARHRPGSGSRSGSAGKRRRCDRRSTACR